MSVKDEIQKRLDSGHYEELPPDFRFKALRADLELAISELPDRKAGRPPKKKKATPAKKPISVVPETPPSPKPAPKPPEKPVEAPTACPRCKGTDLDPTSPGIWKCKNISCSFIINPALQQKINEDKAKEAAGEDLTPEQDANAVSKPAGTGIGAPPKLTEKFMQFDPKKPMNP